MCRACIPGGVRVPFPTSFPPPPGCTWLVFFLTLRLGRARLPCSLPFCLSPSFFHPQPLPLSPPLPFSHPLGVDAVQTRHSHQGISTNTRHQCKTCALRAGAERGGSGGGSAQQEGIRIQAVLHSLPRAHPLLPCFFCRQVPEWAGAALHCLAQYSGLELKYVKSLGDNEGTRMYRHARAHTWTLTHTQIHTHAHAHAHAYTHTHFNAYPRARTPDPAGPDRDTALPR